MQFVYIHTYDHDLQVLSQLEHAHLHTYIHMTIICRFCLSLRTCNLYSILPQVPTVARKAPHHSRQKRRKKHHAWYVRTYVCMCICIYIYIYSYMYVHKCMYVCTHAIPQNVSSSINVCFFALNFFPHVYLGVCAHPARTKSYNSMYTNILIKHSPFYVSAKYEITYIYIYRHMRRTHTYSHTYIYMYSPTSNRPFRPKKKVRQYM
jgi:hypothetical protein